MKNKHINTFILVLFSILAVCLRPVYGLYTSATLCSLVATLVLFIKGWLRQHCDLMSYIKILHHKIKNFVDTQAKKYNSIVWYKQPKYWLLVWAVGIVVLMMIRYSYLRHVDFFVRNLLYLIPFLPFIIRGYAFPFILLLLINPVFELSITVYRFFAWDWWNPAIIPLIGWLWLILVKGYLICLCFCIERKANKKHKWQQILFDTIAGLFLFVLCICVIMR